MMRINIRAQREVARIHLDQPVLSSRAIARATGCAPGTVQALRRALDACGLIREELAQLSDTAFTERLFGPPPQATSSALEPDWNAIHDELQKPDMTLLLLWQEWKEGNPEGCSYSQFARRYRKWRRKVTLVMRQIHRAGEKGFVDFAGRTVDIHQPDGSVRQASVFVAVLGASNYTFSTLVWTQNTADWIEAHNRMALFFGGLPQFIVPDNLKAGVLRAGLRHLILNPSYRAWAEHYDVIIIPAGSGKPKHKAKAELGVQLVQRWILARLRARRFLSIEEANAEVSRLIGELNRRPFKKMAGCRQDRFESLDRPALRPLPPHPYEYFELIVGRRVPDSYHLEYDKHFYSVHHGLVGELVDLRVTSGAVEILHKGVRVAGHVRSHDEYKHSTLRDHMPPEHQHVADGEPAALLAWARTLGPATEALVGRWLTPGRDYVRGLVSARGLHRDVSVWGGERIESAAIFALRIGSLTLTGVRSILRTGADRRTRSRAPNMPAEHENVRGADYFARGEDA